MSKSEPKPRVDASGRELFDWEVDPAPTPAKSAPASSEESSSRSE